MKLQHGANTFYQWQKGFANFQVNNAARGQSYRIPRGRYGTYAVLGEIQAVPKADAYKQEGYWVLSDGATNMVNKLGYCFHLGGLDNDLKGPLNGKQKFFAKQINTPGADVDEPSKAMIYAGDPDMAATQWSPNDFSAGITAAMQGNGMPGGRYVVTLRATDVNGEGLYVEYDVPITLPFWATRANSPLRPNE